MRLLNDTAINANQTRDVLGFVLQVASSVKQPETRARGLAEIAGRCAKAGLDTIAAGTMTEAIKAADEIPANPRSCSSEPAQTLYYLLDKCAAAGLSEHALTATDKIRNSPADLPLSKAQALIKAAGKFGKAGRKDLAEGLLSVAESLAFEPKPSEFQDAEELCSHTGILLDIAEEYLEINEGLKARNLVLPLISSAADSGSYFEGNGFIRPSWAEQLTRMALRFAKAGQRLAAARILSQLLIWISDCRKDCGNDELLSMIAECYAKMGRRRQADRVADGIERSDARVEALRRVQSAEAPSAADQALHLAKRGEYRQAILAAGMIENLDSEIETLTKLASVCAEAGDQEAATDMLSEAVLSVQALGDNVGGNSHILSKIAKWFVKIGRGDRALEVARGLEENSTKAETLAWIARECGRVEGHERALEILAEALEGARKMDGDDSCSSSLKVSALGAIARAYAQSGHMKLAGEILCEAVDLAETMGDAVIHMCPLGLYEVKAETLAELAETGAQVGRNDLGMRAASAIESVYKRDEVLMSMAEHCAEVEKYGQALQAIMRIQDIQCKVIALASVGIKMRDTRVELDDKAISSFRKITQELRAG